MTRDKAIEAARAALMKLWRKPYLHPMAIEPEWRNARDMVAVLEAVGVLKLEEDGGRAAARQFVEGMGPTWKTVEGRDALAGAIIEDLDKMGFEIVRKSCAS